MSDADAQGWPLYEANPDNRITMTDGRAAYIAEVVPIPGISLRLASKAIVGYSARVDLPVNKTVQAWIDFALELASLVPEVQAMVQRIVDAQTHLYYDPVQFNGPFLGYINSDTDVYADQSVSFTNFLGLKSDQQLYTGDIPGMLPNPPLKVGPVAAGEPNPIGRIKMQGQEVLIFDRPVLKG